MMSYRFFKKVKSGFKRQSKPSEVGSAGTEEAPNKSVLGALSPAPSEPSSLPVSSTQSAPSASGIPTDDETPHEQKPVQKHPSLNVWQDAFSQLDTDKQNLLLLGLEKEGKDHDKEMTSAKIEIALQSVIETVQQQHEIRTLKNDNKVHKAAKEILGAASSLREVIGAAVACDPTGHASTAWTIISLGLKMTENYGDQQNQWFESSAFLADALSRTTLYEIHYFNKSSDMKGLIEKALLHVYIAILNYSAEVIKIGRSRMGKRIFKSILALNQLPLTDIKSAIATEELRLESLARMQEYLCLDAKADKFLTQGDLVLERVQNVDHDLALLKLPVAKRAAFNSHASEPREYCLENTSVKALENIEDWVNDSQAKSIFWLQGMAGTGKSTIARTVARELRQRGLLGASFFFNRSEQDCSRSENLLTTIAKQLVDILPQFQDGVTKAIKEDSTLVTSSAGDQLDRLLKKPLAAIRTSSGTKLLLIIVIDALDECQDEKNIQTIIKRLPELQHTASAVELRFCVTSRPESYIHSGFNEIKDGHTPALLHKISGPTIEHDIKAFFQHKLPMIRQSRGLDDEWPGEKNIQILIQMAIPLFIYAATMCRAFEDQAWAPTTSLEGFLNHQDEQSSQLSGTYLPVLDRILLGQGNRQKRQLVDEFQNIVGAVVILEDPLPIVPLAELLDVHQDTIHIRLNTLRSVIQVPEETEEPVRLFHQSFRDYLLDPESDERTQFSIDRATTNKRVGLHCIRVMERETGGLRRNLCNLSSFGATRTEGEPLEALASLPKELQYSCRHWVSHFHQGSVSPEDQDHIYKFLKTHFLHWLEAMGVMGVSTEAVGIVNTLLSIGGLRSELSRFLYDAKRFILKNRQMIDVAPLQIYGSGLVFAPTDSLIRQIFDGEMFERMSLLPHVESSWSSTLQTLEGHIDSVTSVAFSASGQTVASGSSDGMIKLWNPETGKLQRTLEGNPVQSVAFSPVSQNLASGLEDGTVQLWDTTTGNLLKTVSGHSGSVQTIAFSSDGQIVASGSDDSRVKLWDATTGEERLTLGSHSRGVSSVAFLDNGQVLASASKDTTIIFWDTITGKEQRTICYQSVLLAAFSPDNRTMASVAYDSTVRLWNIATGEQKLMLRGHSATVLSVAFSPDSQTVVSGSSDKTIRLWDAATGQQRQIFRGHSSMINAVAFSPGGQTVVSGAMDKMVKLWDVMASTQMTDEQRQSQKRHSEKVNIIALSPDGQTVASGPHADCKIQLWDTSTGKERQTLKGHSDGIGCICFSPDSQIVASCSGDRTVRLWYAMDAEQIHTLDCYACDVAFSPDGRTIACGMFGNIIKLWDTITGEEKKTLTDPSDSGSGKGFKSVAFSPDGQTVVSGSNDCRVTLWDTHTGEQKQVLEAHAGSVQSVAFSPDGLTVVSGTHNSVKIWNIMTGEQRLTMKGHPGWVQSVSFSPDGQTVMSSSRSSILKLWDPATGEERQASLVRSAGWSSFVPPSSADTGRYSPQVSVGGGWVVFGGEPLLWLPDEYRFFIRVARQGGLLALGYEDGRVIIMRIEPHALTE